MRVLMTGYYGRANFGNDVLMYVTYRILRQALPNANYYVLVDGPESDYVAHLLPGITLLSPAYHGHFDLIVHGGGVFFDFAAHGWSGTVAELFLSIIGYRGHIALENFARKLFGKPRTSTSKRLGMGIGVGTFSKGSKALRHKLNVLAGFDALWVRDPESIQNLRRFSSILTSEIILGSDLAFLTEHWLQMPPKSLPSSRPRLGIILRDWPEARGGASPAELAAILAELAAEYELSCFVFDRHTNPVLQSIFAPYRTYVWNPAIMRITDFSVLLSEQQLLLTSRAHGAICGACLGVPSVIIPIEPKLVQVHAMLPHTSRLCGLEDTVKLKEALREALAISPTAIADDVARNRAISQSSLTQISQRFV